MEKDACFCFPCRIYGVNATNDVFSVTGYKHWKAARSGKDKRLGKHSSSPFHEKNMEAWVQQQKREQAGKTIKNVVQRMGTDNEKWLEVIFHVVRFLTANGLPFRGDNECLDFDSGLSGGLYLNTLQHLVFEMQPDLATLAKKMRRNAKYLSSDVQNEII